ncbi:uncharacterized protein LOC123523719 [Mercenaria mercenaria]|uniref:uncharacterized protein LOC123523719 n=1 Tax=Mercenaria mercenaria TaxID=6596 RepID=UPI00234E3D33|nr:uncharacterized protein LOC123523719 [Mercenaria mercenaria]
MKFPRCYFPDDSPTEKNLHIFCDSSVNAYGACAYLVSGSHSTLVMAKNRVAPIKQLTIPKLELCAAVLGARLCHHIITSIGCQRVYLWSDSQIALQWISTSKKQPLFVSNRVPEIHELTKTYEWRYCSTDTNPADKLSRGLSYDKFHDNRLWFHGPDWLTNTASFPLKNQCKKQKKYGGDLHPHELDTAARTLIKHIQYVRFPDVLDYLKKTNSRCIKPALVRQLDLYLDIDQILRCGGRIANAPLPEETRFPYLIPSRGKLTELIVTDAHETQLHAGLESTVTYLGQRFWIPGIRRRVRTIIRTCVRCRKVTTKPYQVPDLPPLPRDRLKHAPPFTVTGIDFTGALTSTVKATDGRLLKVYICLFTKHSSCTPGNSHGYEEKIFYTSCLQIYQQAIHTKSIHVRQRIDIYSYGQDYERRSFEPIWHYLEVQRLIGLTKTSLKKVLGKALINLETLQTLITEVECIINDRPLTHSSTDPADDVPLTPSYLLYGRRITTPIYPDDREEPEADDMSRDEEDKLYRFKSATIEHFWSRWKHEYLTSLREFHKRLVGEGDLIRIGDVVQIHDDTLPRSRWSLIVIDDVVTGADGRTRAARVKSRKGIITRPIDKLYPLELIE